jgi:hypothetical protein
VVDERPEICRLTGESALSAEHLDDLAFGERLPQPEYGLVVAVFQDAGDGVGRVGNRVEVVQVRVPEKRTQVVWDQTSPPEYSYWEFIKDEFTAHLCLDQGY